MTAILRATGAIGLLSLFVGGQIAPAVEPTLISSDWNIPVELASDSTSSERADAPPGDLIADAQSLDYDNDCGCNLCCNAYGYRPWNVIVGAVFLHRSRPDPTRIITPG